MSRYLFNINLKDSLLFYSFIETSKEPLNRETSESSELFAGKTNSILGELQDQKGKFILYFIPEDVPANFIRVPQMENNIFFVNCVSNGDANESLNSSFSSVTSVSTANVGFKELCF